MFQNVDAARGDEDIEPGSRFTRTTTPALGLVTSNRLIEPPMPPESPSPLAPQCTTRHERNHPRTRRATIDIGKLKWTVLNSAALLSGTLMTLLFSGAAEKRQSQTSLVGEPIEDDLAAFSEPLNALYRMAPFKKANVALV